MHDREFEKQVQQKMQELRFPPGADVWARVQADIRKKKRRRPFIIFLLLAGLLAGSAWLYMELSDSGVQQTVQEGSEKQVGEGREGKGQDDKDGNANVAKVDDKGNTNTNATDRNNDINDDDIKSGDVSPKQNIEQNNRQQDKSNNRINAFQDKAPDNRPLASATTNNNKKKDNEPAEKQLAHRYNEPVSRQRNQVMKQKNEPVQNNKPVKQNNETAKQINDPEKQNNEPAEDNEATKQEPIAKQDAVAKDSLNKPADSAKAVKTEDIVKPLDSAAKKPFGAKSTPAKKRNWEWGISTGAGMAGTGKSLLPETRIFDALFASPSNRPDSLGRSPNTKHSLGFHIGGYVSKSISKRLRVKAGLNYDYFSTAVSVGDRVDSVRLINIGSGNVDMVSNYFRSGNKNNYKNSYHFISLPISIQWQLNRNPKRSIVWENGISISRMIHTNALLYDGFSYAYYEDKDAYEKMQLIGSSAMLFRFTTRSDKLIYVGPHVQYGFSNLTKNLNDQHLRYAGLKLMMGFNKK